MKEGVVVAFDCDGTLHLAGGPVGAYAIRKVSSRSSQGFLRATEALGVYPHFVKSCGFDKRAKELLELKREIRAERYVYVAD